MAVSLSRPGVISSKYSITVTSVPNLEYTEPNSKPITPAPTIVIDLGIFFKDKAPVEETTVFSSIFTPLRSEGSDPVAIIIDLELKVFPLTSMTPGSFIEPQPFITSILFFLNRNSIPFVFWLTISDL